MRPIFFENHRNSAGLAMTELRNHQILEFKFKNFEKIKKNYKNYVKKLDQIIRTLVKKKFQISTVLLDKI
jgi:hypothetical protein